MALDPIRDFQPVTNIRRRWPRADRGVGEPAVHLAKAAGRQYLQLDLSADGFTTQLGGHLSEITVAYETWGRLAPTRDNVVLITHALTGDSHVSSHSSEDQPGWWEGLVGPGLPLDTDRFFVVCANVLGGCSGSSGPASRNPATGKPYGMRFPVVTIQDMVRVEKLLLESLGVRRLHAVTGGSMGGMQTLEWAVSYPEWVERALVIGAPGQTSPQSIAYNEVMRQAIMLDPRWRQGDYYGTAGPTQGLSIARMVGMITYNSNASMDRKFGRAPIAPGDDPVREKLPWYATSLPGVDGRNPSRQNDQDTAQSRTADELHFQVESYLHYQGEKLVRRFDANSYIYLSRAMDLHDPARGRGTLHDALARIEGKVGVVGIDTDILYPQYQQLELCEALWKAGCNAEFIEFSAPNGHDSFLINLDRMGEILDRFLAR